MPAVVLVALYLGVLLAPLALAWLAGMPRRPLLDELSSGLALVAFAVLLVEFVLSGRFRAISGRLGMDVTMRLHQRAARWIVALIVLHPFLYTSPIPAYPPPWDVTAQSHLRLDGATLLSGGLAWLLLIVLVITAIARDSLPYRYETWRLAHGLGAALVAGLTAHHALGAGRYSAEPMLAGFWQGLLGLALVSLGYVYVISPLLKLGRPFEVLSVRPVAERTWELAIARKDGKPFVFAAGQFVWLNVGHAPFSLHENPFSISSAPATAGRVEFVIKEAGDFTRSVPLIPPGTRAWVDGPHGSLLAPGPEVPGPEVPGHGAPGHGAPGHEIPGIGLIAGGVGIAPLLGILRQLRAEGDTRPVVLLYGNRAETQIVYRDELDRLAAETPTQVIHVLGEPPEDWRGAVGLIDAAAIARAFDPIPDARRWHFLLCGPPGMISAAEAALAARGVPRAQVRAERFRYD